MEVAGNLIAKIAGRSYREEHSAPYPLILLQLAPFDKFRRCCLIGTRSPLNFESWLRFNQPHRVLEWDL